MDNINHAKSPEHAGESKGQPLRDLALQLFQCKDGSLVKNPRECIKTLNDQGVLPSLEIAGRTYRNGADGTTTDGGKHELT